MEKTVFQIDGSKQADVVKGIRKAEFDLVSMNRPMRRDEVRDILGTLSDRVRRSLSTGAASFIPRGRAEFSNGDDSVTVNDFDIKENQTTRPDPVIIVMEQIPGRTSSIIKEILEETVTVDIIKAALLSVTSRKFKNSVKDLARITNENPNAVYNRCINTLVKSCVSGFRRLDIRESDLLPKKIMQKIPRMVA